MVRKSRPQSSTLFLMELILAILFFSIASAVCVQFFVKSHLLSKHSQELSHAVNECSAVAEICKTSDSLSGASELIRKEYAFVDISLSENCSNQSTELTLYFDKDFVSCSETSKYYELHVTLQEKEQMLTAEMQVLDSSDDSVIYELKTQHHIPRRTTHE